MSKIKTRSNKGNSETTSDTTGALGVIRRRLVFPPTSIFTMKKTEANKKSSNNMPQDSNTQNINGNGTSQIPVLREMESLDIGTVRIKNIGSLPVRNVIVSSSLNGQRVLMYPHGVSYANFAGVHYLVKNAASAGGCVNIETENTPVT